MGRMDRLSQRNSKSIAYTRIPLNESWLEIGACYTGKIADRIAAYEDTGLEPEEIVNLNDFSTTQCAKLLVENGSLRAEVERLRAENAAYKADIEAGRLVRLPDTLIAPYELNDRYWVSGWDSENCTLTIQDRKMKEAARAALEDGEAHE